MSRYLRRFVRHFFVLLLSLPLVAALPTWAEHKMPTEAQCKQMTEGMLNVMRTTPPKLEKEKDRKDALAFLARAEKIVSEGRAKNSTECEIWSGVSKLIAHS